MKTKGPAESCPQSGEIFLQLKKRASSIFLIVFHLLQHILLFFAKEKNIKNNFEGF
jgi:hypothetical protein